MIEYTIKVLNNAVIADGLLSLPYAREIVKNCHPSVNARIEAIEWCPERNGWTNIGIVE